MGFVIVEVCNLLKSMFGGFSFGDIMVVIVVFIEVLINMRLV